MVKKIVSFTGHISGCHINPAVTVGLFFGGKIGLIKTVLYVVVQCVGAIVGAALLKAMAGTVEGHEKLGITLPNENLNEGQAFGVEFFIAMVLVLVVFAVAGDEDNAATVRGSAPLAIGLSITACHLAAIPLTGSGMNPARSLGPAAVVGDFTSHWVYWIGPLLGGMCAAFLYQLVLKAPPRETAAPASQYDEVRQKEAEDGV